MRGDRISLLPDNLLHHILSFLNNTKFVVQTSVLSKRFQNLWISIPTLIFDYSSYQIQSRLPKQKSFHDFILKVLSQRSPITTLKKLYFSLPNHDPVLFKLLFYFAASHHVEEIFFNGDELDFSDWSCCLSTCRSMKLSGFLTGKWVPLRLEFLKSLDIENDDPPSMNLDGEMFSSCLNLERLILRGYWSFTRLKITAPKLEYLEMEFKKYNHDQCPEMVLFTPQLEVVVFRNVLPVVMSVENLSCLKKVELSLSGLSSSLESDIEKKQLVAEKLSGLLNVLQNAKSLTIDIFAAELLSQNLPDSLMEGEDVLHKFKYLTLKANKRRVAMPNCVLSCLLQSPSLESLDIELPS